MKKMRKKDKEGIKYFDKLKYLMEQYNAGEKLFTYNEMCDKAKNEGANIWDYYEKIPKGNINYWRKKVK